MAYLRHSPRVLTTDIPVDACLDLRLARARVRAPQPAALSPNPLVTICACGYSLEMAMQHDAPEQQSSQSIADLWSILHVPYCSWSEQKAFGPMAGQVTQTKSKQRYLAATMVGAEIRVP